MQMAGSGLLKILQVVNWSYTFIPRTERRYVPMRRAVSFRDMVRTTFIIDENGIVKDVITDVDTKNSAGQILNMNK